MRVPEPQPQPEPEPEPKTNKRINRILFWIILFLVGGISSWAVAERMATEPVVDSVAVDSVAVVPVVVAPPPFDHSRIDSRLGKVEQQQRAVLHTLDTLLVVMDQFTVRYGALDTALDRLADGLARQEALTDQLIEQQIELVRVHNKAVEMIRALLDYAHKHQEGEGEGYHH